MAEPQIVGEIAFSEILDGIPEETFIVNAILVRPGEFTVNALIKSLGDNGGCNTVILGLPFGSRSEQTSTFSPGIGGGTSWGEGAGIRFTPDVTMKIRAIEWNSTKGGGFQSGQVRCQVYTGVPTSGNITAGNTTLIPGSQSFNTDDPHGGNEGSLSQFITFWATGSQKRRNEFLNVPASSNTSGVGGFLELDAGTEYVFMLREQDVGTGWSVSSTTGGNSNQSALDVSGVRFEHWNNVVNPSTAEVLDLSPDDFAVDFEIETNKSAGCAEVDAQLLQLVTVVDEEFTVDAIIQVVQIKPWQTDALIKSLGDNGSCTFANIIEGWEGFSDTTQNPVASYGTWGTAKFQDPTPNTPTTNVREVQSTVSFAGSKSYKIDWLVLRNTPTDNTFACSSLFLSNINKGKTTASARIRGENCRGGGGEADRGGMVGVVIRYNLNAGAGGGDRSIGWRINSRGGSASSFFNDLADKPVTFRYSDSEQSTEFQPDLIINQFTSDGVFALWSKDLESQFNSGGFGLTYADDVDDYDIFFTVCGRTSQVQGSPISEHGGTMYVDSISLTGVSEGVGTVACPQIDARLSALKEFTVDGLVQATRSLCGINLANLKAYWTFDESSGDLINQATSVGSVDSLGTSADGTVGVGIDRNLTGQVGDSYEFEGLTETQAGNRIFIGTSTSQFNFMHTPNSKGTFNFWINPRDNTQGFADLFITENNSSFNTGMSITIANGLIRCRPRAPSTELLSPVTTDNTLTPNVFNMVTVVWDETIGADIYFNGVFEKALLRTAGSASSSNADFRLSIASRTNPQAGVTFDGFLDEATAWDRKLAPDEISKLFVLGNAGIPIQAEGAGCVLVDAIIKELDKDEEFEVNAIIFVPPAKLFLVQGITLGTLEEEFLIDSCLQSEPFTTFEVDACIQQNNNEETFTVDSLVFTFPVRLFLIDSIIRYAQGTTTGGGIPDLIIRVLRENSTLTGRQIVEEINIITSDPAEGFSFVGKTSRIKNWLTRLTLDNLIQEDGSDPDWHETNWSLV